MLAARVAKANELGCKVSLAVARPELPPHRLLDDGRRRATSRSSPHAAKGHHPRPRQRQPTGYAPEENALSMAGAMGDSPTARGFPITVAGEVVGAVAAGGAKIEQGMVHHRQGGAGGVGRLR